MSYYQYYQQQPNWGTSNFQVGLPPRPMFQPQSNWGGSQFFRAQAGYGSDGDYDDGYGSGGGLFDSAWGGGRYGQSGGLAAEEAQLWHRRVYGGLAPIAQLSPLQLGAAAGYEAFRQWSAYGSTYRSPLGNSIDRQREALAGIAAGEVAKLLGSVLPGRSMIGEAARIAVATAQRLFREEVDGDSYGLDEDPYRSRRPGTLGGGLDRGFRPRPRRSSFSYGETGNDYDGEPGGPFGGRPGGFGRDPYGGPLGGGLSGGIRTQPRFRNNSFSDDEGDPEGVIGRPLRAQSTGAVYGSPAGLGPVPLLTQGTGSVYGSAQPSVPYVAAGGPVQYATTGGQQVRYATTGVPQVQYVQGGTQYSGIGGQSVSGNQGTAVIIPPPGSGTAYAIGGQQAYGAGGYVAPNVQYVQAGAAGYPGQAQAGYGGGVGAIYGGSPLEPGYGVGGGLGGGLAGYSRPRANSASYAPGYFVR